MHIFLTGATGFIGSHLIPELHGAGHRITGVTRREDGAATLRQAGVTPFHGTLEDPQALAQGIGDADAVIHTAFDHDMSRFAENAEKDRRVITALGAALKGSARPLVITSGTGIGSNGPGTLATEDAFDRAHPNPRIASEEAGQALRDAGVDVRVMRLPQVHDRHKQGLVPYYARLAKDKGVAAYVGAGENRWAAGAVDAVATLYRLAIERGAASERYHAVTEEGVAMRDIAAVVGEGLGIPLRSVDQHEAVALYGAVFGNFIAADVPASSAWTQVRLDWDATGPTLLEDLRACDWAAL